MIWFNFLISYLVLIALAGIGYTAYCWHIQGKWDVLLYPALTEFLDVKEAPIWVRRLVYFLFTIMLLPYLIVYYTLLFLYIIIITCVINRKWKKSGKK